MAEISESFLLLAIIIIYTQRDKIMRTTYIKRTVMVYFIKNKSNPSTAILSVGRALILAIGGEKKKSLKQASFPPFQLSLFSSIVLTVLEQDSAQGKTWKTIECQPSKAILQNCSCSTYVVPPGPKTAGISSTYIVWGLEGLG